jgi:hypothetical protein
MDALTYIFLGIVLGLLFCFVFTLDPDDLDEEDKNKDFREF